MKNNILKKYSVTNSNLINKMQCKEFAVTSK